MYNYAYSSPPNSFEFKPHIHAPNYHNKPLLRNGATSYQPEPVSKLPQRKQPRIYFKPLQRTIEPERDQE